jgi:DNA ligase-associated metallophosphoesterase
MTGYRFTFHGAALTALPSGALHWPDADLVVVSDLHLGKAERLARRGGALLPPYDTRETLARLDAVLDAARAGRVLCLGDSFDDLAAAGSLDEDDRLWLLRLMAGRDWIWVEGNHDTGPLDIGGSHRSSLQIGPITFRHIVEGDGTEVGGHYHPKVRVGGTARPCFLIDRAKIILPAFGAFTGGLYCDAPVLDALMAPGALAVATGRQALPLPMPRRPR